MKSKIPRGLHRFPLSLLHYGNSYYIERVAELEQVLARKPRRLQLELLGEGEIAADWALLLRSILAQRSPRTELITHARSSLKNASVLVWLLGDRRLIREDARVFFRRANLPDESDWRKADILCAGGSAEVDPDEADYLRVLQLINEFLPVNESVGRLLEVAELRQLGLVDAEHLDRFLATAFARPAGAEETSPRRSRTKASASIQPQK
jgi:hypothetical protein